MVTRRLESALRGGQPAKLPGHRSDHFAVVTLRKYGSGEPDIPPNQTPGTSVGSLTNPDVFLHDSTYQEPIYETRLECNPGFAWRNAACTLPPITDAVHQRVAAATGIIVEVDNDHVSSCSGTLVGADLTDGLQNTVPMLEDVEGSFGNTIVNVIGLGSDADLNGPLLTRVAHAHGGHFTRATDGLALRKFFGLSFGNIFENGALTDPEAVLRADQKVSEPHGFDVCGEERITLVLTWDDEATPLRARLSTPSGKAVSERRIRPVRGRNWAFWRVPLPYDGERDGHWQFTVERVGDGTEFPPPPRDVRYQYLVICSGGPKLVALPPAQRLYTGDPLDLRVGLHYASGTFPSDAEVTVQVTRPDLALGLLTTEVGLSPPQPSGDALDAFHATLQAIAARAGGRLPVGVTTAQVQLFDDGLHDDGAMEPDGNYNHRLTDLTQVEGTYQFRAVARYGTGCSATREAHWSVHVEPGIDPGRTDVTLVDVTTGGGQGGHSSGVLVIVPAMPMAILSVRGGPTYSRCRRCLGCRSSARCVTAATAATRYPSPGTRSPPASPACSCTSRTAIPWSSGQSRTRRADAAATAVRRTVAARRASCCDAWDWRMPTSTVCR